MRVGYVAAGALVTAIFLGTFFWAVTYREYVHTSTGYTIYGINPAVQGLMVIFVSGGVIILLYGLIAESPEAASQSKPTSSSNKCWKCGTKIEEDWMICPMCKTQFRWRCPKCNQLLSAKYRACPYCGYEFVKATAEPESVTEIVESEPVTEIIEPVAKVKVIGKCPQCGTLIGEGLSYCRHCGWKVVHEELT